MAGGLGGTGVYRTYTTKIWELIENMYLYSGSLSPGFFPKNSPPSFGPALMARGSFDAVRLAAARPWCFDCVFAAGRESACVDEK